MENPVHLRITEGKSIQLISGDMSLEELVEYGLKINKKS